MENIEKKSYEKPEAEKMMFNYRDQVVAASTCQSVWVNVGDSTCESGNSHLEYLK